MESAFFRAFGIAAVFFIAVTVSVPLSYASTVSTYENKTYRPNVGVVTAPNVLVSDQYGLPGSLSGATAFSLVIPTDSNVRFSSESLSWVSLSGISGVVPNSLSSDLRTLRFISPDPIPSFSSFTVSGIRVVVYGKYSPLRGFDLDVGSDGTIDAYDPNGVRVNEEYGIPDTLAPFEPVNATGAFSSSSVRLSALPSGDVDFESFSVSFESASGDVLKTELVPTLSSTVFELPIQTAKVRIRSVDSRSNLSSGIVLSKNSGSIGTLVPLLPSQNPAPTLSGSSQMSPDVAVSNIAPYVPTFKNRSLSSLLSGLDAFIASKTPANANSVMEARNVLAKSFEDFYRTRLAYKRKALVTQIKSQVATLKSLLK